MQPILRLLPALLLLPSIGIAGPGGGNNSNAGTAPIDTNAVIAICDVRYLQITNSAYYLAPPQNMVLFKNAGDDSTLAYITSLGAGNFVSVSGIGSGLTALQGYNITPGTVTTNQLNTFAESAYRNIGDGGQFTNLQASKIVGTLPTSSFALLSGQNITLVTNSQSYVISASTSASNAYNGSFAGNALGLTNVYITNASTIYVGVNGNDTNSGAFGAPLATVAHAVAIAKSGTTIQVGLGSFPFNRLAPGPGVTIRGEGRGVTTLLQTNGPHGVFEWIVLTNSTTLADFTLSKSTNVWLQAYPLAAYSDVSNFFLLNIEVLGDSDDLTMSMGSSGKAVNCRFFTHWDGITTIGGGMQPGGPLWCYNCEIYATAVNNAVVPNGLLEGIHTSANNVYYIGGSIVLTGSTNDAFNISNDGSGETGTVYLSGVHLENHPSANMGQNSYYLVGDVVVDGHPYSDALPPGDGGAPVYLTDGLTTWNGDVTNAPTSGALMAVQPTGERYWTATLSVGGPGIVTNNGAVWYVTNNIPSIAMPKGSLASDTLNGDLYVNRTGLANGWVKK